MNPNPGDPPHEGPADGMAAIAWPLLIGRDAQQHELLSVVVGLEEADAAGALLIGESGTGKTSLLQSVRASVRGLVLSRARAGDEQVPYATLSRWLRALLASAAPALDDTIRHALATLLPELAAHRSARGDGGAPSPAVVAQWLHRAATDVVGWAIDDVHLADEASARWWLQFLRRASPQAMPFILATEPPPPGSAVETLLEAAAALPGMRSMRIGVLDRPQVFDWVIEEGAPAISATRADAIAARLMQATGGSPLHLHLLLHEAQRGAGSLLEAVTLPQDMPLPALSQLLGERLSRLSPAALAIARAAAVAAQDAGAEAAMDFTGLTADEYSAALHELRQHELWAEDDFAHERFRDAARQATPQALAQALHAHVASWIEGRGGEPERIAAHWLAAQQPSRALPALQRAGRRARQLDCMAHAIACLMRAATIAEEHGQLELAFECACEAFETHADALRHTDGTTLLAQMERLARTPQQRARAATQAAWHAMVQGRLDEALQLGDGALRLAEAQGDARLLAQARQVLGTALGVAGQLQRALALLLAAEPTIHEQAPADERASLDGNLAAVLDNLGRPDDARKRHLAALAQVPRDGDAQRSTLLANYAIGRLESGDPIGARELGGKAQVLVAAGHVEPAGLVALVMAGSERALGRYTAALEWCDRAERVLAEQAPQRMPLAHLQRAQVWLDLGLHERALQLLDGPGLPLGRQLPARHAVRWLLQIARARSRAGTDATPVLDEAERQLPAEGWPELAWLVQAQRALALPGPEATLRLRDVAQAAGSAGLDNVALGAWLQCAWLAAAHAAQATLARTAADTALAMMMRGVEPTHVERALRWLAPARALAACGETERARGLTLRGQHWLATTAARQVPPACREAFLEAQPLNRQLRATPVSGV